MSRAILAAVLCLAAGACGRRPAPAPSVTAAPAVAPARAPASAPASRPRPPRTEPSAPGTVMTSGDGLVRVTTPAGAGWECLEQMAAAGTPAGGTLIKCRRPPPEFFFLVAKDYEVPPTQVLSPAAIAQQELPKHYRKLFTEHRVTRTTPCKQQGADGVEIELAARHHGKGDIAKLERIFTKGTHVFILSAEGRRADFEKLKAAFPAWVAAAAFSELGR